MFRDIHRPAQWFRDQRFPLYISKDSRCAVWGRLFYASEAFLPGVATNWGFKANRAISAWSSRFNPQKLPGKQRVRTFIWLNTAELAHKVQGLDRLIYFKGGSYIRGELRTIPFLWFTRADR